MNVRLCGEKGKPQRCVCGQHAPPHLVVRRPRDTAGKEAISNPEQERAHLGHCPLSMG